MVNNLHFLSFAYASTSQSNFILISGSHASPNVHRAVISLGLGEPFAFARLFSIHLKFPPSRLILYIYTRFPQGTGIEHFIGISICYWMVNDLIRHRTS